MSAEPLAIIGIGCRFPGADSPATLYANLLAGTNSISAIPADRVLLKRHATAGDRRARIPDFGGFLGNVTAFDSALFRFSPREAEMTDPQQRLMLQVAWEALEDGAISAEDLRGAYVPVYVGALATDYQGLLFSDIQTVDLYGAVNTTHAALAGRVAHCFDWSGPAVGLDTACSSSLTAMHLACQSIWAGDAEVALFGATNVLLAPELSLAYARAGMLAADGHCKAFDSRGDGFVRSEGAAAIIVKRLSAALRDGNPIYATVRATWLNHDGGRGQYKTPNRAGQRQMLESVYARAGLSPLDTQYVEAHGTGTRAGDPVEVAAIGDVLCAGRSRETPLYMGSIKTNIGHCEAAAGMASIAKVALSLRSRRIPRNLHFSEPNPAIAWDELALRVPTETVEWVPPKGKVARAGVSSFGLTGVNAHAIMEGPPEPPRPRSVSGRSNVWIISAPDRERVALACQRLEQSLSEPDCVLDEATVHSVARTLAVGRKSQEFRAALWGDRPEDLREGLGRLARGEPVCTGVREAAAPAPAICFVFSGHGGQWPGMGRQLLCYPVFEASLKEVASAIEQEAGFDPIVELSRGEHESRLDDHAIAQPTLFALQVALAALWRSLGVAPSAVVGHSMGEVSAAYVAGILDLRDAVTVICRRSRLMKQAPGEGAMLVVELPEAEVDAMIAQHASAISLGVHNSPTSRVLSGDKDVLHRLAGELEARGAFARFINVGLASHSPQMDPVKGEFLRSLAGIQGRPGQLAFHSTVRRRFGRLTQDGAADVCFDAQYFWENLRNPVRFSEAVADLVEEGHTLFVEVNPHPMLCHAVTQTQARGPKPTALPSMRRNEDARDTLMRTAAELFVHGVPVQWRGLLPSAPLLHLPPTPLRDERFEVDYSKRGKLGQGTGRIVYALPVEPIELPDRPAEVRWQVSLDPAQQALWAGHCVEGEIVFPAAGYIELGWSLAARLWGTADRPLAPHEICAEQFRFERALSLPATQSTVLHVVATRLADDRLHVVFATAQAQRHAEGSFVRRRAAAPAAHLDRSVHWATGVDEQVAFYAWLRSLGLQYAGPFRAVTQAYYGEGRGLGQLARAAAAGDQAGFTLHPATLDACLQVAFTSCASLRTGEPDMFLPTELRSLRCYGSSLATADAVSARRISSDGDGTLAVDLDIWGADGGLLAQVEGFAATRLDTAAPAQPQNMLWELAWSARALADQPRVEPPRLRRWLVQMDDLGLGARIAEWLEERGDSVVKASQTLGVDAGFQALAPGHVQLRAGVPAHHQQLLAYAVDTMGGLDCVLDFWPTLEPPADELDAGAVVGAAQRSCMAIVESVKALAEARLSPRLWLITREVWQAQNTALGARAAASAVWGLGRVVAVEQPELRCTLIDVSAALEDVAKHLVDELAADTPERELRLSCEGRSVARIVPMPVAPRAPVEPSATCAGALGPFLIEAGHADVRLLPASEPSGRASDVIIEVEAVRLPCDADEVPLPMVLAGRVCEVTAAGHAGHTAVDMATDLRVAKGARVLWIGPDGPAKSVVAVPAADVWALPDDFCIPTAVGNVAHYLAAYHALVAIGGLERGARVLVIAAANLAQPAIYVARWARAQVVVLCAADELAVMQRSGLDNLVQADSPEAARHVRKAFLDARADLLFVAGELPTGIKASDVLEPDGRCVWLATGETTTPPRVGANQTLHAVALDRPLALRDPALGASLRRVRSLLEQKMLPMLDFATHKLDEVGGLDRAAWGTLTLERPRISIAPRPGAVRSDRTYLITGGLGGLGLTVARALAEAGARSVVAVGRSAPGAQARVQIEALRERGVVVTTLQADVSREQDVRRVMSYIDSRLPPLAGIVHSAGVLADAIVLRQEPARFARVFGAKAHGAWNLVRALGSAPLDFFVLFSSAAGLLGSPGQGNYAAANGFLDGLANALRARGVPAKSLQWGPWAEVGLAARTPGAARLSSRGLPSFSARAGAAAFMHALGRPETVMAAMRFDAHAWAESLQGAADDPRLEHALGVRPATTNRVPPPRPVELLARGPAAGAQPASLSGASAERDTQHADAVLSALRDMVASLARVAPARIEPNKPISAQGLDSLMMVELRDAISRRFGTEVPVAALIRGPSLLDLSGRILADQPHPTEPVTQTLTLPEPRPGLQQAARHDVLGDLCAATARLLRVSEQRIDARKSIAEQGMDSLMMLELRGHIEEHHGVKLPVALLVKGPSLQALAEHIEGRAVEEAQGQAVERASAVELGSPASDMQLPPDVLPQVARAPASPGAVRRVLLIGATGYLGRYLATELLRQGASEVCCLVRAEDDGRALERVRAVLDRDVQASAGLKAMCANLDREYLGVGRARLQELMSNVDAVVHNAATVHFRKSYGALRQTNVQAWLDVIRASAASLPRLHFVSSWGAFSSAAHAGKPVHETDWPAELPSGGYRATKFVCELLAREARQRGFPVQVHRPGLIGLDSQSGVSNPRELFTALVATVVRCGLAPDFDMWVPSAPVNAVAQGMAAVVLDGALRDFSYHWVRTPPIDWHGLLDWLASEGVAFKRLPYPRWRRQVTPLVVGSALEPFVTMLPETLTTDSFGYIESALRENQPWPFDNTRTSAAVPTGTLDGPAFDVEAWRQFLRRIKASSTSALQCAS